MGLQFKSRTQNSKVPLNVLLHEISQSLQPWFTILIIQRVTLPHFSYSSRTCQIGMVQDALEP